MAGLLRRIRWGRVVLAFVVLVVLAAAFVLLLGHHDNVFGGRLTDDPKLLSGVDAQGWEEAVGRYVGPGAVVRLRPFEPYEVRRGP